MKNNQFIQTWKTFGFKVAWRNWMLSKIQRDLRLKSLTVEYIGRRSSGLITRFDPREEIFSYELRVISSKKESSGVTVLSSDLKQGELSNQRTFRTFINHFKAEVQNRIENPTSNKMTVILNRVTYPSGIAIRKQMMSVCIRSHNVEKEISTSYPLLRINVVKLRAKK